LAAVKNKLDAKELKFQEVNFALRDAESRVRELEQKESFYKA